MLVSYLRCGEVGRFGRVSPECVRGRAVSFPPGEAMATVQREVEVALQDAAATDLWLSLHPPRLEWVSGSTGAEVPPGPPAVRGSESGRTSPSQGSCPSSTRCTPPPTSACRMVQRGIPTVGLGPLGGDLSQNGEHDGWVDVEDASGTWDAALFDRATLEAGDRFAGPAIVMQLDATILVPPGWWGRVEGSGALVLTHEVEMERHET